METYLLKSAACLAILFIFYKIILENTSLHTFKRFYLLSAVFVSLIIPAIVFTTYIAVSSTADILVLNDFKTSSTLDNNTTLQSYLPYILSSIYGLGVLFFSIKFFRNLFSLIQKIKRNPKVKVADFTNVLLTEKVIPHTFLSYIFFNRKKFESDEIPHEVKLHEQTHAKQKHSLDILFIELFQVVFWFNPIFYFLNKSIKLNHEFLADKAVLNLGVELSNYQKIILSFTAIEKSPDLANSLTYSSIKKRFTIMKTKTSNRAILLRTFLLLPILSLLIYGFSTTEITTKLSSDSTNTLSASTDLKKITLKVVENQIYLNNQKVSLDKFTASMDNFTKNWKASDFKLYNLEVTVENTTDLFREKINIEYRKTFLAQQSIQEIPFIVYLNAEDKLITNSETSLKHIDKYGLKKGIFYFEGQIISSQDAKNLIESNPTFSMVTQNLDALNPITTISRDPINSKKQEFTATKAELAEYNKLAKKYNAVGIENRIIKKKDLERLKTIYKKMSPEQKREAQPFPKDFPPPPPPTTPPAPPAKSLDKATKLGDFKNATYYYEGEKITPEKAEFLLKYNKNLGVNITKSKDGAGIITVMENSESVHGNFPPPPPPPPPAPPAKSLDKAKKTVDFKNATYYYEGEKITPEKAELLLKYNKDLGVNITKSKDGAGIITIETILNLDKKLLPPPPPPKPIHEDAP